MSAQPQPQPKPEPQRLAVAESATGVTLRVDFSTGRIIGPVDPADLPLSRPRARHDADVTELPRRRAG